MKFDLNRTYVFQNKWIRQLIRFIQYVLWALAILIVVAWAAIWIWAYFYSHSLSECRYFDSNMNSEEKIRAALLRTNLDSPGHITEQLLAPDGSIIRGLTHIPYENIDTILKKQPDCCKLYAYEQVTKREDNHAYPTDYTGIGKLYFSGPITHSRRGLHPGVVVLAYKAQYEDRHGNIYKVKTLSTHHFNRCR